jgi:hypothetical protein
MEVAKLHPAMTPSSRSIMFHLLELDGHVLLALIEGVFEIEIANPARVPVSHLFIQRCAIWIVFNHKSYSHTDFS